jgi:hypothetical protein
VDDFIREMRRIGSIMQLASVVHSLCAIADCFLSRTQAKALDDLKEKSKSTMVLGNAGMFRN